MEKSKLLISIFVVIIFGIILFLGWDKIYAPIKKAFDSTNKAFNNTHKSIDKIEMESSLKYNLHLIFNVFYYIIVTMLIFPFILFLGFILKLLFDHK